MKKLLKILALIVLLLCLGAGGWVSYHLWPRTVEAPLWTEADLKIPEDPNQNGYYFFFQMKENPNLVQENLRFSEELSFLKLPALIEQNPDPKTFWDEVKAKKPQLESFVQQQTSALGEYEKLLNYPQFIDQDPISIKGKKAHWLMLIDLQDMGRAKVVYLMEGNHPEEAYALWLKMFELDQKLAMSARDLVAHQANVINLRKDLMLLSLLKSYPLSLPNPESLPLLPSTPKLDFFSEISPESIPESVPESRPQILSPEKQTQILQALQSFHPETLSTHRAVVSDYLQFQNVVKDFEKEGISRSNYLIKLGLNRALYQKEINEYFRRIDQFSEHPEMIHDEDIAQIDQEIEGLQKGPFWRLSNPGGKILRSFNINQLQSIRMFYRYKASIQKLHEELLTQPLFPAPVESKPTETLPTESQPKGLVHPGDVE